MNVMRIKDLIKKGEGQDLEFKSKLTDDVGKVICAFANTNGGVILVGIDDKGCIVGAKEKDEQAIANVAHTCKPSIYPELEKIEVNDKIIFIVEVKKSGQIHSFKNIAYIRVGSHDKPLSAEELIEFAKEKKSSEFDSQICEGATLADVDEEKVRWFLEVAKAKRNYPFDKDTSVKRALSHLNLLRNEKPTNAAILLLGKDPPKFYLQAETKCVHFHGTEIEKPFETYHIYKDNIFDQVDDALGFVLDRLKRPVIPEQGKPTTQRPYEIPEFVVREAIVNAIIHRDYYSTAGVQVMVFADRVEMWNPGELPPQLTLDSLRKPHPSVPRNPLMAESFYLTTYIEKAGSGTLEMIKQCRDHGLPEPEFEQKMGCFVTTVWRDIYSRGYLAKLNLNERQEKAIQYVKEQGSISNSEYCSLVGISRKTATTDLVDLVNKKIFEPVGAGKRVIRYLLRLRKNYAKITQKQRG